MSDSEEEDVCPLCAEPLDATDKHFFPCPCRYQICLFCITRIREKNDGKCPACRAVYDEDAFIWEEPEDDTTNRNKTSSRKQKKRERNNSNHNQERLPRQHSSTSSHPNSSGHWEEYDAEARILATQRVVQRTLLYVVGIHHTIAREEILRRKEYFGRFGKILKIAVSAKRGPNSKDNQCSAYITFRHPEDTAKAIAGMHNTYLHNALVKCTYGTTKYCSYFLRRLQCTNPACLFLHEKATQEDSYAKEDPSLHERTIHMANQLKQQGASSYSENNSYNEQDTQTEEYDSETVAQPPSASAFPTLQREASTVSNSGHGEQKKPLSYAAMMRASSSQNNSSTSRQNSVDSKTPVIDEFPTLSTSPVLSTSPTTFQKQQQSSSSLSLHQDEMMAVQSSPNTAPLSETDAILNVESLINDDSIIGGGSTDVNNGAWGVDSLAIDSQPYTAEVGQGRAQTFPPPGSVGGEKKHQAYNSGNNTFPPVTPPRSQTLRNQQSQSMQPFYSPQQPQPFTPTQAQTTGFTSPNNGIHTFPPRTSPQRHMSPTFQQPSFTYPQQDFKTQQQASSSRQPFRSPQQQQPSSQQYGQMSMKGPVLHSAPSGFRDVGPHPGLSEHMPIPRGYVPATDAKQGFNPNNMDTHAQALSQTDYSAYLKLPIDTLALDQQIVGNNPLREITPSRYSFHKFVTAIQNGSQLMPVDDFGHPIIVTDNSMFAWQIPYDAPFQAIETAAITESRFSFATLGESAALNNMRF